MFSALVGLILTQLVLTLLKKISELVWENKLSIETKIEFLIFNESGRNNSTQRQLTSTAWTLKITV